MKKYWGGGILLHVGPFLIQGSGLRLVRLTLRLLYPGKRNTGSPVTGSRVGLEAALAVLEKKQFLAPARIRTPIPRSLIS